MRRPLPQNGPFSGSTTAAHGSWRKLGQRHSGPGASTSGNANDPRSHSPYHASPLSSGNHTRVDTKRKPGPARWPAGGQEGDVRAAKDTDAPPLLPPPPPPSPSPDVTLSTRPRGGAESARAYRACAEAPLPLRDRDCLKSRSVCGRRLRSSYRDARLRRPFSNSSGPPLVRRISLPSYSLCPGGYCLGRSLLQGCKVPACGRPWSPGRCPPPAPKAICLQWKTPVLILYSLFILSVCGNKWRPSTSQMQRQFIPNLLCRRATLRWDQRQMEEWERLIGWSRGKGSASGMPSPKATGTGKL